MIDFSNRVSQLRQEYERQRDLFGSQPPIVQRFLESQSRQIADGFLSGHAQVRFTLPDRVVIKVRQAGQDAVVTLPDDQREQKVGHALDVLTRRDIRQAILHRLRELEQSPDEAVAAGAELLRYASAFYMISNLLPAGRTVAYRLESDDSIPSIPMEDHAPESAITQAGDAIVEQGPVEEGRGELQTPFVPAARVFFLPQWVAFDSEGRLLVGSEKEAEGHLQSMQNFAQILHAASALTPCMVASEEYQRKRYGILGQLVNQGRALATFKTGEIIREIKDRLREKSLNRGLSITMSYFDDQALEMKERRFEVIPAGRIMFIPAFVVRACRDEQAKVGQDTRLNPSTRKHLLNQLGILEKAFQSLKETG